MFSENYSRQTAIASATKVLAADLSDHELATLARGFLGERAQVLILLCAHAAATRRAERRDLAASEAEAAHLGEVRPVLRVGPGPAAFDEVDPELSEALGQGQLVGEAQIHAETLCPIA